MIAVAAVTGVAFGIAEGSESGLLAGGWMLALVALLYLGCGRFDSVNVMFGAGDERTQALYERRLRPLYGAQVDAR